MKLGDKKDIDSRHMLIKAMLDLYWLRENPTIPSLPWGAADAGALAHFLRANPKLNPLVVEQCLVNRLNSEDHASAERVHRWIGDVLRYASGPLNRFKQPKQPIHAEASAGSNYPGKVWSEPAPTETARQFMGEVWFERTVSSFKAGKALTEIQRNCLREEGLL
jgi:hypothetical protein